MTPKVRVIHPADKIPLSPGDGSLRNVIALTREGQCMSHSPCINVKIMLPLRLVFYKANYSPAMQMGNRMTLMVPSGFYWSLT